VSRILRKWEIRLEPADQTKGKVLVGDGEKENGVGVRVGVLIIQHFSAINPISTFRNAKTAVRHDCLKQSTLPSRGRD
jgi:hypothetical protein